MTRLIFLLVILAITGHAYGFVFEAEFTDLGDTPINTVSVVKLKVYDPAKSCLLFEENFNPDLSLTNGKVSLELGSGTQIFLDGAYSSPFELLINNGQITGSSCTYTPVATDGRILEVSFDDGTNGLEPMGDVNILPAPQASFASQSKTSNGLVLDNGGLTTTFATQASGNYTLSFPADAGTNGQVLTTDGSGNLTWTASTDTSAATLCTAGEYLDGDGACYPISTGVTNINGQTGPTQGFATGTAGTAPAFSSAADTHTLNIPLASNVGVTSGTISKTDYDNFANKQNAIAAGTTNQYFRGDLTFQDFAADVNATIPDTDALTEGGVNLYFTNARARTAAVVNSTVGTETDQAPSVSAMKSYVAANGGTGDVLSGGNSIAGTLTIGTNDNHPFNLESFGNSLITLQPDGRVGIGTATPPKMFSVITDDTSLIQKNNVGTGVINVLDLTAANSSGTGAAMMGPSLTFTGETTTEATFKRMAELEARWTDATNASGSSEFRIRLSDGGTMVPKFMIKPNGNVGIDHMTPATKLHVAGTIKIGDGAETCSGTMDGGMVRFVPPNLEFCDGTSWQTLGGGGAGDITNNGNTFGNDMRIGTDDPFSLILKTNGTDSVFITSGGDVGIGTNTPAHNLHVVGTAGLSTGTTWTAVSDSRLKDIQGDYEHGLEQIMQLKTVRFNYKKENKLGLPSDKDIIGFIAQEVQQVIPEAVSEREDGYLQLNVDPIHWALVNATQEQQKIIEDLTTENAEIKQELADIKSLVCSLKPEAAVCR